MSLFLHHRSFSTACPERHAPSRSRSVSCPAAGRGPRPGRFLRSPTAGRPPATSQHRYFEVAQMPGARYPGGRRLRDRMRARAGMPARPSATSTSRTGRSRARVDSSSSACILARRAGAVTKRGSARGPRARSPQSAPNRASLSTVTAIGRRRRIKSVGGGVAAVRWVGGGPPQRSPQLSEQQEVAPPSIVISIYCGRMRDRRAISAASTASQISWPTIEIQHAVVAHPLAAFGVGH